MANIKIVEGDSALVTTAIHNGHKIRPALLPYLKLTETERLREEDPHTGDWAKISDNHIHVQTSRFEVDINRQRDKAVYQQPEDAWGLEVWNDKLPTDIVDKSLQLYDEFYSQLEPFFDRVIAKHGFAIVYDLHTYNHRREGFEKYASAADNPEINIGTGNVNREVWGDVIDTMIQSMHDYNFEGRNLSIGENVKFKGGHFGKWLQSRYQDLVCTVSIEVKKFFMNEWTGELFEPQFRHTKELLISTIKPVTEQARLISVR